MTLYFSIPVNRTKLCVGLRSGKYSQIAANTLETDSTGISPAMFKNVIGKYNSEFLTKQQQDAQEFFLALMNAVEKNSRFQVNPSQALKFSVEDRFECGSSGKVKYTTRDEWCLPLPIPMDMAKNLDEVIDYEKRRSEAEAKGEKLYGEILCGCLLMQYYIFVVVVCSITARLNRLFGQKFR